MVTIAVPETALDNDEMLALSEILEGGAPTLTGQRGEEMVLPEPLYSVLREAVKNLQQGQLVSVIAREERLSTQMAAEILGCSRPHVVKLLEAGEMPFEMVGSHRRIRYADVMDLKSKWESRRTAWSDFIREEVAAGRYVGVPLEEGQNDE